jgi:putative ABC transport system substrate-binding protein
MAYAESDPIAQSLVAAFEDELTKLGSMTDGKLQIEQRWGAGNPDRIRAFAKELVNLQPDAILGQDTAATRALASETKTIPIVFAVAADPIGTGFAANFARPGGNITGFSSTDSGLGGKWVELLARDFTAFDLAEIAIFDGFKNLRLGTEHRVGRFRDVAVDDC